MENLCVHCKKSSNYLQYVKCSNDLLIRNKFKHDKHGMEDICLCEMDTNQKICRLCFHKHFSKKCDLCQINNINSKIEIHHLDVLKMNESEFIESLQN